jgi:hypothetical protein
MTKEKLRQKTSILPQGAEPALGGVRFTHALGSWACAPNTATPGPGLLVLERHIMGLGDTLLNKGITWPG